jgi:glycine hydroxymethyltransferase
MTLSPSSGTTSTKTPATTDARSAQDLLASLNALADEHDTWRGHETVNLNAANSVLSPAARRLFPTRLADKGISGGLGRRHHMGGRFIDEIESIVVELGRRVLRAEHVEYRPASGSIANALALGSLVDLGDTIMTLGEGAPGHQSYRRDGWGGRLVQRVVDLPFDHEALDVDVAALRHAALEARPKLLVIGTQMMLFPYNLAPIREIADEVGSLVMYDGAHVMGLMAGGAFQDPLREGADLITGSIQKSLPGPIGGLILTDSTELGERIFDNCTRLVSNYENNRVAVLGVTLAEMETFGSAYAAACNANAQAQAYAHAERGFTPLGEGRGYTASNQVILDLGNHTSADAVTERWERANIIATAVTLPAAGPATGHAPNGIRIGVQELTRLGMGAAEMEALAGLMREAADASGPDGIASRATEMVTAFPTVYYCFEHPHPPGQPAGTAS